MRLRNYHPQRESSSGSAHQYHIDAAGLILKGELTFRRACGRNLSALGVNYQHPVFFAGTLNADDTGRIRNRDRFVGQRKLLLSNSRGGVEAELLKKRPHFIGLIQPASIWPLMSLSRDRIHDYVGSLGARSIGDSGYPGIRVGSWIRMRYCWRGRTAVQCQPNVKVGNK